MEFNRLNSVNRKSLSLTRDIINVAPNVGRFVFWITEFIIPVISTLVSTQSFVEFLLTHPCGKIILTLGPHVDPFLTPFQTFRSTTLLIKPWIRRSFMCSNGLKKNHILDTSHQKHIGMLVQRYG